MNEISGTAADLLHAATRLFAENGYEGTSVRAITREAGTNLGAITYHFGSKEALYESVFAEVAEPSVQYLARATAGANAPLERIERFVRAMFDYLQRHSELPRLITHHVAGSRPMPEAGRRTMRGNLGLLSQLIAEGQQHGSIRKGDPFLMALSVGAQPLFLSLMQQALREGTALDQGDAETRRSLVESVVEFVRRGLVAETGGRD